MIFLRKCKIRWPVSYLIFLSVPLLVVQLSCNDSNQLNSLVITKEDSLLKKNFIKRAYASIAQAKPGIHTGDIITRTGTDFTSQSLKSLNQRNKTYSHCGIASIENDSLFIYHAIGGEWNPDEKLKREPFEVFATPYDSNQFGIFRFNVTDSTRLMLARLANNQFKNGLPFDMKFDLKTNDRMYCAEFIYKTLQEASSQELIFNKSRIGSFLFVGVDDVFLHPACKTIAQVVFK